MQRNSALFIYQIRLTMTKTRISSCLLLLLALLQAGAAYGEDGTGRKVGSVTNLPIPRFVSLRSDTVNLRMGPGDRYPVEWVYHRKGLPVRGQRTHTNARTRKGPAKAIAGKKKTV